MNIWVAIYLWMGYSVVASGCSFERQKQVILWQGHCLQSLSVQLSFQLLALLKNTWNGRTKILDNGFFV